MGDLIKAPHSEINAFIERLDALGVMPEDLKTFRRGASWNREVTARILKSDPLLCGMLEMEQTAAKVGLTPGDFKKLAGSEDKLRGLQQVLRGFAEIKPIQHLIDCDADPFIPDGWSVAEHQKGGKWKFNPAKVKLWLSKSQQAGTGRDGNVLCEELTKKPVLNANVLDYLLKNPHLIPEEWKDKYIFFWGTIYRGPSGGLYVRCLSWGGGKWYWGYHGLHDYWHVGNLAALRAN